MSDRLDIAHYSLDSWTNWCCCSTLKCSYAVESLMAGEEEEGEA